MEAIPDRRGEQAVLEGIRVLVVEDIALLAWRVCDVLRQAGAEVVGPVPDVARALALLDATQVDVAVLDLNLNGERADPIADVLAARGVPFVFLTGYGSGGVEERHASRPTLGKPLQPHLLLRTLAELRILLPLAPETGHPSLDRSAHDQPPADTMEHPAPTDQPAEVPSAVRSTVSAPAPDPVPDDDAALIAAADADLREREDPPHAADAAEPAHPAPTNQLAEVPFAVHSTASTPAPAPIPDDAVPLIAAADADRHERDAPPHAADAHAADAAEPPHPAPTSQPVEVPSAVSSTASAPAPDPIADDDAPLIAAADAAESPPTNAPETQSSWDRFSGRSASLPNPMHAGVPALGAAPSGFLGERQRDAFATLGRALADGRFWVALTGPAGVGKTTLLQAVLTGLPGVAARVVRIEDPAAVDEAQAERIAHIGRDQTPLSSLAAAQAPRTAHDASRSEPPSLSPDSLSPDSLSPTSLSPTSLDPTSLDPGATDAEGRLSALAQTPDGPGAAAPANRRRSRGETRGHAKTAPEPASLPASRSEHGPDGDGHALGQTALLVVDDAHAASPALLGGLTRLAAADRDGERAAQLLLVGRPELWDRLEHDAYVPLAERLVLRLTLKPWSEADARGYIAHLLAQPHRAGGQSLAPEAEREVIRRAQARPDRLRALIEAVLASGDPRTRPTVTLDDVFRADGVRTGPQEEQGAPAEDARGEDVRPSQASEIAAVPPSPFDARAAVVVLLAAIGALAGGIWLVRYARPPREAVAPVATPTPWAAAPLGASIPGQEAFAPALDGPAGSLVGGPPVSPQVSHAPPPPMGPDRDAALRDSIAPALTERGDGDGGTARTVTPPRSTPPDRPEEAAAPDIAGRPSSAPTDGARSAQNEWLGPVEPLSPSVVLATLLRQGDEALADGDPARARLFYARVAATGDPRGMRGMARSFDPAVVGPNGGADPRTAATWYARAAALGDAEAAARRKRLEMGF